MGQNTMRIILVHPNYHSGGAEIAGNWPPAWAAYLAGAWTFAGSGRFAVISIRPWILAIANNPLARDQQADAPVCAWHATVFETLFRDLLRPAWRVTEIGCCAKGDEACQFMACVDPDQHARIPHPQTLAS